MGKAQGGCHGGQLETRAKSRRNQLPVFYRGQPGGNGQLAKTHVRRCAGMGAGVMAQNAEVVGDHHRRFRAEKTGAVIMGTHDPVAARLVLAGIAQVFMDKYNRMIVVGQGAGPPCFP